MTSSEPAPRNLAVLTGNGLSIAYNKKLELTSITSEAIDRIENLSKEEGSVTNALKAIVEHAFTGPDSNDFEKLVGAFNYEEKSLMHLEELAKALPTDGDLHESIRKTARFARAVSTLGTRHTLEIILEHSKGSVEGMKKSGLYQWTKAVLDKFSGQVRFGNLNYDTLLLATLLQMPRKHKDELSTLRNWGPSALESPDGRRIPTLYRKPQDFPQDRRIQLLSMHGSLTYWYSPHHNDYVSLPVEDIRTHGFLKYDFSREIHEDSVKPYPAVVLTSQADKGGHVQRFPFSLAYEQFEAALRDSKHWLIVGYSFRDTCVNELLHKVYCEKDSGDLPRILISTWGEELTEESVRKVFVGTSQDVTIERSGVKNLIETLEWERFAGPSDGQW